MVTLQTGRPLSDVVMGVHKQGGELTWIQINSCPLLGDDGKPTGVVTTFHDITEQKLLRDMLQTRDEQFARGFQSSPVIQTLAAVGSDGESRIVNVNEAFERQTGYRRYEAIGRTVRELGLWADGAALDAAVNEFRTKGSIDRRQFQLRTKHGEIREALTSVGTAEWDGRIYAVTNIVDLGDLQFSQPRDAAMRSLFENCSEPLLVFSMELHVVEANAAARELLGYGIEQLRQMPSGSLLEDAAGFPSGSRIRTAAGWPLQMEDRGVSTDAAGDPVQMVVLREIAAVH